MNSRTSKVWWLAALAVLVLAFVVTASSLMAGSKTPTTHPTQQGIQPGSGCPMQQGTAQSGQGCGMMGGMCPMGGNKSGMMHQENGACMQNCTSLSGKVVSIDKKNSSVTVKAKVDSKILEQLKVGSSLPLMICGRSGIQNYPMHAIKTGMRQNQPVPWE